jgi:hypothetical protein
VTNIALHGNMYAKSTGKYINKATVFNVRTPPTKVLNAWASNMPGQTASYIPFIYNEEESTVTIHDFYIPVDTGLEFGATVALFEFIH